jgi:hypothetical protein
MLPSLNRSTGSSLQHTAPIRDKKKIKINKEKRDREGRRKGVKKKKR